MSTCQTTQDTPAAPASDASRAVSPLMEALQEACHDVTGAGVPITSETRIDRYFIEMGDQDLDCLECLDAEIVARFGVELSQQDWDFVSGGRLCKTTEEWELLYAPMFTFGRLADLIEKRRALGTIRPITVLGISSGAAGAFRYMVKVARQIQPRIKPFAPSTPIKERLSGRRLGRFWTRMRAVSGNRLPSLTGGHRIVIGAAFVDRRGLYVSMVVAAAIILPICYDASSNRPAGASTGDVLLFAGMMYLLAVGIIALIYGFIAQVLRLVGNRIHKHRLEVTHGIETFRDLAEVIAGERGGWCAKCGYELTGVASGRCPECGTPIRKPIIDYWAHDGAKGTAANQSGA